MRTPRNDCPMRFNVWNVHGTWFWSLVYPDQHGGAIGAAASEPEAVGRLGPQSSGSLSSAATPKSPSSLAASRGLESFKVRKI